MVNKKQLQLLNSQQQKFANAQRCLPTQSVNTRRPKKSKSNILSEKISYNKG